MNNVAIPGSLSPEEKSEIDHFMGLEHILLMAKARAADPDEWLMERS